MNKDTVYNLELRLQRIDEKIAQPILDDRDASNTSTDLKDERAVTKQCIRVCEDAKSYMDALISRESSMLPQPSYNDSEHVQASFEAQHETRRIFDENQNRFAELIDHLQGRLRSLVLDRPPNDPDQKKLQEDTDISRQCLEVCRTASEISRQKIYREKSGEIDSPSESDMKLDDEDQRMAPSRSPIESLRKKKSAASESGESELGSIFSEESRNSSRSSSEGFEAADKELAYMFLTDAQMKPLFQCALSKVNLEKFSRNFKRLIVHYGRNLEKEASEELHKHAARYVRHSAHQVTMHIKRAMILEVRIDQLSKTKQVNDWLQSLQGAKESPSVTLEAEGEDQNLSSGTDSDESEVDEDFCSQTLSDVQEFMTTAEAFATLRDDFQQWLETGKRQSCKVLEQQPADSHLAVSTQGPSDNHCLGENDGLQNRYYWTRETLSPVSRVWKTIVQKIMFRIVPLFWTKPPKDYKRITWLSALGRPLYIDVKELAQGAAERLQERFRSCAMNKASPSSQSFSGTSVCVDPISTPPPAHLRADTGNSSNINKNGDCTALTDVRGRDISQTSHESRYLLLCFSTHQSETFRQVDVTNLTNDQFLFSCIRDIYIEIKNEESWYVKVPLITSLRPPGWILWLLGDLHFFTPKEVNFVSVSSIFAVLFLYLICI
jgi:hypothetical protein